MMYTLKLPLNQRKKFAEPLDILIAGNRDDTIYEVVNIFKDLKENGTIFNFYLVGDIVTQDFMNNLFLKSYVKIAIIDGKTKRERISIDSEGFFEEEIKFQNPAGLIHKYIWPILKDIIASDKRTLIRITEGEEDLLALPLIVELPISNNHRNYVFYGQPPITDSEFTIPQGIVIVEVNSNIKQKVQELIEIMVKA